ELVADERLAAYAEALPAPARVSEPALPLVLAALHEHLGRGLVCLLPEDADARDAADGARWFLGDERVALLPSRGVHWGSGLEPPPHLVGERARALEVLAAGGLVCASAAAVAEPLPPPEARPEPIVLSRRASPGLDDLAARRRACRTTWCRRSIVPSISCGNRTKCARCGPKSSCRSCRSREQRSSSRYRAGRRTRSRPSGRRLRHGGSRRPRTSSRPCFE